MNEFYWNIFVNMNTKISDLCAICYLKHLRKSETKRSQIILNDRQVHTYTKLIFKCDKLVNVQRDSPSTRNILASSATVI